MVMTSIKNKLFGQKGEIDQDLLDSALNYIDSYWSKLEKYNPADSGTLVGLPNRYIVPAVDSSLGFSFYEQYYWDSYFIALGLTDKKYQKLVEGMLDNLISMYHRFGLIPNASRMYFTSRSQPPMLTSFIWHVYDSYNKSDTWLRDKMEVAKHEYQHVWMDDRHPHWHNVHQGLSRYYDINVLHDLAEAESGWDMTPRFERKCLDYLPIDLNALLYKYEDDFSRADAILGDKTSARHWQKLAVRRKNAIDKLMWGKLRGFYFDYNHQRESLGDSWSLAGYYTMWAGLASPEQAKRMVENLPKFEKAGGLSATTKPFIDTNMIFGSLRAQWAYPNGWAPLQYLTIIGLKNYGYDEQAHRLAVKWINTNLAWYKKHGVFLEKYNVVNLRKRPLEGLYPSQTGFGWTNAVFVKLVNDFDLKSN